MGDTNIEDTAKDPNHDICSENGNRHNEGAGTQKNGWYCAGFLGHWKSHNKNGVCEGTEFTSPKSCVGAFRKLWFEQLPWLERGLKHSKADWQIIVTHFPAYYPKIAKHLKPLSQKYGVDFIISGHVHNQEMWYHKPAYGQDWGNTALLVSGGGGGIFSEGDPKENGHDNQYGFMDLKISKDTITASSYSWHVRDQEITVSITPDLEATDEPKCCWGTYWGCEDYPGAGGLCRGNWTQACQNDQDCGSDLPPAPSPGPSPTPSLARCAGKYVESQWPHNNHQRFQGGTGKSCTIYWDSSEGWVLSNTESTNSWVCSGGKSYAFPAGHWEKNPAKKIAERCNLSVSKGEMIRMMRATVGKTSGLEYFNESIVI